MRTALYCTITLAMLGAGYLAVLAWDNMTIESDPCQLPNIACHAGAGNATTYLGNFKTDTVAHGPYPAISLLDPETRTWTAPETRLLSGKHSAFDLIHAAHSILRDYARQRRRAARLLLTTEDGRTLTTAYVEPDLKT